MQVPEIKYPVYLEVLKQILIEEGLRVSPYVLPMTAYQSEVPI